MIRISNNLGIIYASRLDYDLNRAWRYAVEAKKSLLTIGSPIDLLDTHRVYGMIYRVRGELDKALVSINNSLEIALKLNSPDKIANSYYELGLIFTKEGKLEEARNAFQKSLEVFEKLKAEWRLPYVQLKLREVEVLLETGKKE